ncbi:Uncharacterised protein [Acinetobacter baumannii]|nr:Uncharacterised protein [Acinetobacter baumannii]
MIFSFADAAYMQIGQRERVAGSGQGLADVLRHRGVHFGIQQNLSAIAHQAIGPGGHHRRADDAHQRIEPGCAPKLAAEQRDERQHRGGGVGEHVNIGGTQVEVMMSVVVVIPVMMMVAAAAQQPGAEQVDGQPDRADGDGFVVMNRAGIQQPLPRLKQHQRRHQHQQHCAGVTGQHFDLPGAEAEAAILGQPACGAVSQHRQAQGQRVRTHVPAVGQQRHRVKQPAAGDLDSHHTGGEYHRPSGVSFGQWVTIVKNVAVLAVQNGRVRRHGEVPQQKIVC